MHSVDTGTFFPTQSIIFTTFTFNNNEDDTDLHKIGTQFNLLNKETEQNVQCFLILHPP